MNEPFTFDLFLSYAPADRAWVHGYLIPALGVPRERIITPDDFRLGAARVSEIERAVTTSRYSVLVLSATYLADEWATFSEQLAAHLTTAEQAVRLIPLLKSDCELPLRIDFRVRLDCTDPDNWERETARLRDLLNQPAPQPEQIECPYPGMIPFRVEDARWFYGRAKEIDELVRRIRVQNFLFVIGPSGSGKSSLVFAGLVAELHKRQPNAWHVQTMRPGSNPLTALNDSTIALSHHRTNALIIIDQLEELFTQSDKPTQAAFIARLKSLRAENRCTIVVTMRADFYPDLMNSDLWPLDPSERVEIAPLRGVALAEAIGKPAEQVGVYLEAGLVERLLADAADEPGVLPLVQETMVLLWDKRERRLLPLRAYEELGQGNLSGLAVAIATRADAVFARLAESQRKIARRIFLRLVQFGEGRADTRRQQRVSALRAAGDEPNEFDRTLKHLTDHRLLTTTGEEKDADRQVDIAHEALIAGWQRFRQWVNERREAEQTRRRLEDKAREWERLGRGSAGLLDDVELREAENWLKSADATDLGYSETLPELIDISRAEIQQAEREKEEARQRELAQAKALADEQRRRAEAERRSRVRQRYFTIGLGALLVFACVFLLVAVVAAGLALIQSDYANQQRAEAQSQAIARATAEAKAIADRDAAEQAKAEAVKQSQISESRRLATNSASNREQNFSLALLLGLEALRLDNNLESRGNLLGSLASKPELAGFLWGHAYFVSSVAFSPDGKTLASGSADSTIILWDTATRQMLGQLLTGHKGSVESVAFSPDGKTLASGSADSTIILWDTATRQMLGQPLKGHTASVMSVAFSPDGKTLASGSVDTTIILWDIATRQMLGQPLKGHTSSVMSVAFSPDGKTLASGSDDNTIILWDVATRAMLSQPLKGHTASVWSVAFSPDGKTLASGSADKTIILWDVATRQMLGQPLKGHTNYVSSVAFSPDGKTLASSGKDGIIILWDMSTRQPIGQPLRGHKDGVNGIAFSSDGKILASGSWDNTIILWDVSTQQPIGQSLALLKHPVQKLIVMGIQVGSKEPGPSIAFSPDGKTLVSGSTDGTIILWDAVTRQPIGPTPAEPPVYSVAFSPDGKMFASGSSDSTIILWDLDLESWKSRACYIANRNLTRAEWAQYIDPDSSKYRATCDKLPLEPVATPTPKP